MSNKKIQERLNKLKGLLYNIMKKEIKELIYAVGRFGKDRMDAYTRNLISVFYRTDILNAFEEEYGK